MAKTTYRVGLLGAGFISEHHAKAIKMLPNAQLIAVCDVNQGQAQQLADTYGVEHVTCDLDEMLAMKLDVVHVLTPPDSHVPLARKILMAGVDVFLEKPMGADANECQDLVDFANNQGRQLGVNHNFLFLPAYQKLRDDFHQGKIGTLNHLTVNWFYPLGVLSNGPYHLWMVRKPGNLMLELGSHLNAFALDLFGKTDTLEVDARDPIELPTGVTVPRKWQVRGTKDHATFELNLSMRAGFTDRSLTVHGHGAVAHCDYERNLYRLDSYTPRTLIFHNAASNLKLAGQYFWQGISNLAKNIVGTLRKRPDANPFEQSMAGSIRSFYDTLGGDLDPRVSGQFGADVIRQCEQTITTAQLPENYSSGAGASLTAPSAAPDVLVLGGTGFIGRYLVEELVKRGHNVRVVTRSDYSGKIALDGLSAELCQGSLKDSVFLDEALQGIDTVFHLARAVGNNWNDYLENDVNVTRLIAEHSIKNGVKHFIYTGTIDSYYSGDSSDTISGDTPLDPQMDNRNFYARSKAACEDLLKTMHQKQGLPLTIFRPGIVIGEGCNPYHWGVGMWWSDTLMQYWGDGNNNLPFVLAEDVASGLVDALDKPQSIGEQYNLIDKPLLSARDYIDACSKASGTQIQAKATPLYRYFISDAVKNAAKFVIKHPNYAKPSYRDWKSRSHCAVYDSQKTIDQLGWQPAGNKEALIEKGVNQPMRDMLR